MEREQFSATQFERFRTLIYEMSGMQIRENKVSLLSNRIRRRLAAGGFTGFDAYYSHLTSNIDDSELDSFLDAITTNETFFYRTRAHFDWFTQDFIPAIVREANVGERARSLRVWSAGCASGAEAYTIAMCILENRFRLRDWSITILGTDISEEVLREARKGEFRWRAVEGVSEQQLERYFEGEGERRQLRASVRELALFEQHNLMTPLEHAAFDCIFIRNVLIYFDRESKRRVVENLIRALVPGGYLVVGPSEGIYDMLKPLERRTPFLYQQPCELARP